MDRTKRKSISTLLAAVVFAVMTCFAGGGALLNNSAAHAETAAVSAADLFTTEGLKVTQNVHGTDVGFTVRAAGDVAEHTEYLPDDKYGVKFESIKTGRAAAGSSVTFNQTYTGLFELDFRAYTKYKDNDANWWDGGNWYDRNNAEEIRMLAITLTDADSGEKFTVGVAAGRNWNGKQVTARAYYGEVRTLRNYQDGTYIYEGNMFTEGTTAPVDLSGTDFTRHSGKSTLIGFDPTSRDIYYYNGTAKTVIANINNDEHVAKMGTGATALKNSKFENYTVTVTVAGMTPDTDANTPAPTAKFIIYSLNGQALGAAGGSLSVTTGPSFSARPRKAVAGAEYVIPAPRTVSVLNGEIPFNGTVKVTDGEENEVLAETDFTDNLKFTPAAGKTYKITYKGATENGLSRFADDTTECTVEVVAADSVGSVSELIETSGLDVKHNVSGTSVGYRQKAATAAAVKPAQAGEIPALTTGEHTEFLKNDAQSGILFTSQATGKAAEGSSVTFKNTLSGLFEIDFRAFTEKNDNASDWWDGNDWFTRNNAEEIREVAITLTDSDTNEKFTVFVMGGRDWNAFMPAARVAYGDGSGSHNGSGLRYGDSDNTSVTSNELWTNTAAYGTDLPGTSFTQRATGNGTFNCGGYPTVIGFDPITRAVYGNIYVLSNGVVTVKQRTILDLSNAEHIEKLGEGATALNGSKFENYTVKFSVRKMTPDGDANTPAPTAKFLIYALNGQSLGGSVEGGYTALNGGLSTFTELPSKGVANKEYVIPAPKAVSVFNGEKDFNGFVKVLSSDGGEVMSETAWADNLKFTPTAAGQYKIVYYGATENGAARKNYEANGYTGGALETAVVLDVAETAPEPEINYSLTADKALLNQEIDAGATGLSVLDLSGDSVSVSLSVTVNGEPFGDYTDKAIGKEEYVVLNKVGVYEFTYTVTDYVGTQKQFVKNIDVKAMTLTLSSEQSKRAVFGEDFFASKDDINVFLSTGKTDEFELSVKVGENGANSGEDGKFNLKSLFTELGQTEVTFTVTVGDNSESIAMTVIVEDKHAPVITAANPDGLVFVSGETIKNFRGIKDGKFDVPDASAVDDFDGTADVTVTLKSPSAAEGIAVNVGDEVILSEDGTYMLVFSAADESGNAASVAFNIEVGSVWFEISASDGETELGGAYAVAVPAVKDTFTDSAVNAGDFTYTVSVEYLSDEVSVVEGKFTPVGTGKYTVTYSVTYMGKTLTKSFTLTVSDTVKPVISVEGVYAESAIAGEEITVLAASATDNGKSVDVSVKVLFNGVEIEVNDGKFIAENEGIYTVVYSATDDAGNTAEIKSEITVSATNDGKKDDGKDGGCGCGGTEAAAVLGLITIIAGAALVLKRF